LCPKLIIKIRYKSEHYKKQVFLFFRKTEDRYYKNKITHSLCFVTEINVSDFFINENNAENGG
jgi:hypothetical protein